MSQRLNHEEKQIRDAFIDGWISGAYPTGGGDRKAAMEAWRTENTTERDKPQPRRAESGDDG